MYFPVSEFSNTLLILLNLSNTFLILLFSKNSRTLNTVHNMVVVHIVYIILHTRYYSHASFLNCKHTHMLWWKEGWSGGILVPDRWAMGKLKGVMPEQRRALTSHTHPFSSVVCSCICSLLVFRLAACPCCLCTLPTSRWLTFQNKLLFLFSVSWPFKNYIE